MEKLLTDDEVIISVRKIKEKIASDSDFDPKKMVKTIQKQKEGLRKLFSLGKICEAKKKRRGRIYPLSTDRSTRW